MSVSSVNFHGNKSYAGRCVLLQTKHADPESDAARAVFLVAETPAGSQSARTVTVPLNSAARAIWTGSFKVPLRTSGTFGGVAVTVKGAGVVTATGSARAARVS